MGGEWQLTTPSQTLLDWDLEFRFSLSTTKRKSLILENQFSKTCTMMIYWVIWTEWWLRKWNLLPGNFASFDCTLGSVCRHFLPPWMMLMTLFGPGLPDCDSRCQMKIHVSMNHVHSRMKILLLSPGGGRDPPLATVMLTRNPLPLIGHQHPVLACNWLTVIPI